MRMHCKSNEIWEEYVTITRKYLFVSPSRQNDSYKFGNITDVIAFAYFLLGFSLVFYKGIAIVYVQFCILSFSCIIISPILPSSYRAIKLTIFFNTAVMFYQRNVPQFLYYPLSAIRVGGGGRGFSLCHEYGCYEHLSTCSFSHKIHR